MERGTVGKTSLKKRSGVESTKSDGKSDWRGTSTRTSGARKRTRASPGLIVNSFSFCLLFLGQFDLPEEGKKIIAIF